MKKIALLMLTAALVLLCACSAKQNAFTLHNRNLGTNVSVGEKKREIDKELGEPIPDDAYYYYSDYGISVMYVDGEARMLIPSSKQWLAIGGVSVGASLDYVTKAYGSPGKDGIIMFDKRSKVTDDKSSAATYLIYKAPDGEVESIVITSK